jgi:hypothetical protein
MMMILRDDQVIEVFDSPLAPPDWIEAIDIENGEYQFCDDTGQRFVGEITKPSGFFRQAEWRLRPDGEPDVQNALDLIAKAKMIEPNDRFPDLESLKRHTTNGGRLRSQAREPAP